MAKSVPYMMQTHQPKEIFMLHSVKVVIDLFVTDKRS